MFYIRQFIVIGDITMRLLALYFAISFSHDIVEFVYIVIMCHLGYDVMCFCIDMNDVML